MSNKESKLIKKTAGVALASAAVVGAGVATNNVAQAATTDVQKSTADKLADAQKDLGQKQDAQKVA